MVKWQARAEAQWNKTNLNVEAGPELVNAVPISK